MKLRLLRTIKEKLELISIVKNTIRKFQEICDTDYQNCYKYYYENYEDYRKDSIDYDYNDDDYHYDCNPKTEKDDISKTIKIRNNR